jgi:phage-related protein
VTSAYNYLIDASIYRSILIGTVAFTIQTVVYAQQGTSYNLNGVLTALYIVVYGTIETLFTIKIEQKRGKAQIYEKVKNKEYWIKFITNII